MIVTTRHVEEIAGLCARLGIPAELQAAGIRMHDICPGAGKNAFCCQVVRKIDSYTVMLQTNPAAASMGWEMGKERWKTLCAEEVEVCLPPEALLLLKDKNSEAMK